MRRYETWTFVLVALLVSLDPLNADVASDGKRDLGSEATVETSTMGSLQPSVIMQANAVGGTTPAYLFVFGSGGFARLNLTNGGIQYCALMTTNGRPTSQCAKVGSFPTGNLANAQMTVLPGHVVITNTSTGVMADCAVVVNITFIGNFPSGSCITVTPGS